MFTIHATLDIINGYNTPLRHIGLRATAYAITAWSFGDPPPQPPSWLGPQISQPALEQSLKNMDRMSGEGAKSAAAQDQTEAKWRQNAWNESRDKITRALDDMVQKKNIKKELCQAVFQSIGDDDRNTLAVDKIMTEMADNLPVSE